MNHGGKRSGAGRKQGSANTKTLELAARASAQGITPIEVMLSAMREKWEAGDKMTAAMLAKDAAPYCHPRLSSVDMNATIRRNLTDFPDQELIAIAGSDSGEEGAGEEGRVTH